MRKPVEGEHTEAGRRHAHRHASAPARLLALVAVSALLLVGFVSIALVLDATTGGDDGDAVAEATATPGPTPTATPKPTPTPVPLTAEQRRQRTAAADVVKSRGYAVVRLRDYNPRKTLRVLLGEDQSRGRLAFFFVNGDYIGNDAQDSSAKLRVVRNGDLRVTLAYGIYAPGDPPDAPSGGPVRVRFEWDGTRLAPMDPLPVPEQRTPGRQGT